MTPAKMLVKHDPSAGTFGDCARCCVAAMLDLAPEMVPHFYEAGSAKTDDEAWNDIQSFLAGLGLAAVAFYFGEPATLSDVLNSMAHNNPNTYYILGGDSHNAGHWVIALNGEIVMDPAPSNSGLIGPTDGYWQVVVFVPLSFVKRRT